MRMTDGIETIAIIPAFNEVGRVDSVVHAAFRASLIDAVVIVDDGSTDDTVSVIERVLRQEMSMSCKPFALEVHPENQGKTEALVTGVSKAKQIGSTSLNTLVFLDADSSPVWSRYTKSNMKLWQLAVNSISGRELEPEVIEGRKQVFQGLLARYIDEIIEPVRAERETMRVGMYQRNVFTDTMLSLVGIGGHAGNRAIPVSLWDDMMNDLQQRDVPISGWEIEGSLIAYIKSLEKSGQTVNDGNFMMDGVVNVGSRVKAGNFFSGIKRMAGIHSRALMARRKF